MNVKCSLGDVLFSNHHEYRRVAGSQDREEFKRFVHYGDTEHTKMHGDCRGDGVVSDGLRGRRYSRSAGPYSSSGARFLGFGARFAGLGSPRSSRAGLFTGGPSTLGKADPTKTFEKRALLSESQKIHHRIYGTDDLA